jgi:hypothetical protein
MEGFVSKLSKTAKASVQAGVINQEKVVVLSDDELVRLLRIDRESHIWPGVQSIDALLRKYDAALARITELENPKE